MVVQPHRQIPEEPPFRLGGDDKKCLGKVREQIRELSDSPAAALAPWQERHLPGQGGHPLPGLPDFSDAPLAAQGERQAVLAPLPLLSWLIASFTQHLRFGNWLDTRTASLPGVPQAVRDTIAELQELLLGRAWAFLLEFQLQPDPDMFGRLLIYLGTAWLELRP
jgi:hypothetical protein